ncbi:MAG: class I SAM-dependent methyltransferase [Myxococcales bacterium]|nr:class I SAM-dependent methyltransferase [Myxococcales bacterium]
MRTDSAEGWPPAPPFARFRRLMLRLDLPPRGSLAPNNAVDPLKYYYVPLIGRVFTARIDLGLALLDGRCGQLLEIGYGSGLLLPTLSRAADRVDGVDLASDPEAVRGELLRLGVTVGELAKGDACALPFPDRAYDVVVAFSIFEHLKAPELSRALAEAHRVLVPGGRLLVGCPAVHRGMNLAFAAIGFRGIDQHHFSSIHDVLRAAEGRFTALKRATWPRGAPLGWAPYNAVLLQKAPGEEGGRTGE